MGALLLSAGSLAACGGSSSAKHQATPTTSTSTTTAPPAVSSSADPGGALTLAVGAQPSSWNCDAAGVDPATCLAALDDVWPSVYQLDPSGTPQLNTAFVTSAKVTSTNPQTVVYQLNPKSTWSDGQPITWQDFAYTWQAMSGSATYHDVGGALFTPATTSGYRDISSVTGTTEPDTVTVTFSQPDPDWQSLFGAGHPVVPAHIAQKVGFDTGFTDPVGDAVSGGPFVVQSFRPDVSLTLVRNPKWWGTASSLASVTLRFATPAELPSALGQSIVGAAEVTGDPGSLADGSTLTALGNADGVTVKGAASATYEVLDLDEATPALADPALRKAILAAVPRAALLKLVPGATDASIDPLGNRFALPGGDGYVDDTASGAGAGDPDGARKILQAAGYTAMAGTPLTKAGQAVTLRITAAAGQPVLQAQEQAVVAALAQIGITVTESDSANLPATLAGTGWDLALSTSTAVPFAGDAAATYEGGSATDVDRVNDPSVTTALTQAGTTLDPTKRSGLLHQADVALWNDAADLPLFQLPAILAYRSDVSGAAPAVGAEGATANLATWTVSGSSS